MDTSSVTKITFQRRKDGHPFCARTRMRVSLTHSNDAATPVWHRWTPFSFAILSQGVVPCYHHMALIS